MSIATQILRADRLARFGEVWRTEGASRAIGAAFRHSRRIARKEPRLDVRPPEAAPVPEPQPSGPKSFAFTPLWRDLARSDAFHMPAAPAVSRRRRSVAMIGDLNLPQCRKYRVEQLDEVFALAGFDYTFSHYEDIPRCLGILQEATHLLLYRLPEGDLTTMYLYEARRLKLPVLYDIDDPLFSVSAYETYANMDVLPAELKAHFIAEAPGYLAAMNGADAISVSTPGLVAQAEQYTTRPVWMRRNFADSSTLSAGQDARAAVRRSPKEFHVAFASGSNGHEVDFAMINDDIARFLDGGEDRRLMILGNFDVNLLSEPIRNRVTCKPFTSYDGYLRWLASADCAVMPLRDDAFNRAKSAVRVLDAAAAGIPAIIGMIGDLSAPVKHGETGLVLEDGESWLDALETLARDRALCRAMGKAAAETLERDWSACTGQPVIDPEMIQWIRN